MDVDTFLIWFSAIVAFIVIACAITIIRKYNNIDKR